MVCSRWCNNPIFSGVRNSDSRSLNSTNQELVDQRETGKLVE
ncbi:hypothetical protein V6Z11_D11G230400 [Gossypium hirsutum]